jgi:hypothetical protein
LRRLDYPCRLSAFPFLPSSFLPFPFSSPLFLGFSGSFLGFLSPCLLSTPVLWNLEWQVFRSTLLSLSGLSHGEKGGGRGVSGRPEPTPGRGRGPGIGGPASSLVVFRGSGPFGSDYQCLGFLRPLVFGRSSPFPLFPLPLGRSSGMAAEERAEGAGREVGHLRRLDHPHWLLASLSLSFLSLPFFFSSLLFPCTVPPPSHSWASGPVWGGPLLGRLPGASCCVGA